MSTNSKSMNARKSGVVSSDTRRDLAGSPSEDDAVVIARTVLRPEVGAAVTLAQYGKSDGDLDLLALVEALAETTHASNKGDLKRGEAILTAQAHTLDAIFNHLAQRAAVNMGEHLGAVETYMKLALRAQSQCRATWEVLATMQNPPLVGYAKQANIAQGHQQVNNAPVKDNETPRTRENSDLQNKLLEKKDGKRLDPGTPCTSSAADPGMATVGSVDWAKVSRR